MEVHVERGPVQVESLPIDDDIRERRRVRAQKIFDQRGRKRILLSQVNGDLATLSYQSAKAGADTLTLTATDGDGGTASPHGIAVTVTAAQTATVALFSQAMSAAARGESGFTRLPSLITPGHSLA